MKDKLDELYKLALAAADINQPWFTVAQIDEHPDTVVEDSEFIAAANPQVVKALVEVARAARGVTWQSDGGTTVALKKLEDALAGKPHAACEQSEQELGV